MLKYAYNPQERYDEARRCSPLPEIYLILIKAKDVDIEPNFLPFLPDPFKTREMCEKAVKKYPWLLKYVPDWFVTHQQMKTWHDNNDYCNDDELIKWYDGYQKCKAQKANIEEELLPIAWYSSRYWDWCVSEDKKKRNRKIVGINRNFFVSGDWIQKLFDHKI